LKAIRLLTLDFDDARINGGFNSKRQASFYILKQGTPAI